MKAIRIDGDSLVWDDVAAPVIGTGEVRIRVHATAVNRADLAQRSGSYPPPPGASEILGLECAGDVVEIGEGVRSFSVGDKVCALLAGGGYAQEVVVPAGQVLPVPEGFDYVQAAAIPEVFATAYLNIYMEAALAPGERVLIHAGASGVGTAASQLCRASGNPCFVTVGGPDKIARCVELGADAGWDRHQGSFAEAVRDWSGADGVNVILDPVGAAYLADNFSVMASDARLVLIGLMGGATSEVSLGLMMMKRLRVIGSTLRARPIAAKARIMDELKANVWPSLVSGAIKPVIETVIPIHEAERAHARVAANDTVGKVILSVDAQP